MKNTTIATNRKAFHEYVIIETYEAGIQLVGSEVKSIRESKVSLKQSYIVIRRKEAWLRKCRLGTFWPKKRRLRT